MRIPYPSCQPRRVPRFIAFAIALIISILAASCAANTAPLPTSSATSPAIMTPLPSTLHAPSSTLAPLPSPSLPAASLTLCLSSEPDSLYQYRAYGSRSKYLAAEHVRQLLFDGPIDNVNFEWQPVILESLPTLDNDGARLETVTIRTGERYYDAVNDSVTEWRETDAPMQRLVMTYTLKPGLVWSDGQPLTAHDSVFAFEVLAGGGFDPSMQPDYLPALVQRTEAYEALDERTVRWAGLPGFVDRTVLATFATFFSPLPRHRLGEIDPTQLLTTPDATHQPIGWGPYVMSEWVMGEAITLRRNPHYFRAGEGLPRIEAVTFRFVPEAADALDALIEGKCDAVLHDSFGLRQADLIPAIDAAAANGDLIVEYAADSAWEHLDFNLSPADDRPALFADPAVRRAVAQCIDRTALADAIYHGHGVVAASIVSPGNPYFSTESLAGYTFDPAAGRARLAGAGWEDSDGDGIVEREATSFVAELITQTGPSGEAAASAIARDLRGCGINVTSRLLTDEQITGIGAQSPFLLRQFDLAVFAWRGSPTGEPQCGLYVSSQIPAEENNWRGSNGVGYSSPAFDRVCESAREAASRAARRAAYAEAQRLLAADLPSLPLFHRVQWLIARPNVAGLSLAAVALDDLRSELADIESVRLAR